VRRGEDDVIEVVDHGDLLLHILAPRCSVEKPEL